MKTAPPKNNLDKFIDNPKRAVWTLAVPMIGGFTVHALYIIVDTIFIGQLGPMALAGVTFVGALFFAAIALGIGFSTGVTANVARAVGERDMDKASRIASNAIGLGACIGLGFAIFGLTLGPWVIPLLGAEGESETLAWEYFRILCVAMPFTFLSMAIRAVLTGEGNAKTPMAVTAGATVLNAALDPLFMFVFGFGVSGAAMATLVSQLIALGVFVYLVVVRKKSEVGFHLRFIPPKRAFIGPIVAIGLPAAAGQLVMAAGSGFVNRLLAVFGQTEVAGYGAGSKVDMIVALPVLGLASAAVSLVGMFKGAGRYDLIRVITVYTYKWVLGIAVVLGVGSYLASEFVMGMFTEDASTIGIGKTYLTYMVFVYPLMAFGMTSGRILQGLGRGMPSLIITLVRVLLIGVPAAYFLVLILDASVESIWMAMIAGGIVANILSVYWIRKNIWKTAG